MEVIFLLFDIPPSFVSYVHTMQYHRRYVLYNLEQASTAAALSFSSDWGLM